MVDFDNLVLGPCLAAFGQPVVYCPRNAAEFRTTGVFDREYLEVSISDMGAPVSTRKPVLGVRASSFPPGVEAQQGDHVIVAGAKWMVVTPEPDGHGHVLLQLKVARP